MTPTGDAVPYLLLGRSLPDGAVTVDILVDSFPPLRWVAQAIALLARTPHIVVRRLVAVPRDRTAVAPRNGLFAKYEALCAARCDFLQPAARDFLAGSPIHILTGDGAWEEALRSDPSDVVLYLGNHTLRGGCEGLARSAAWSLAFGNPAEGTAGFLFANNIMGASTVLDLCIVQHSGRWTHGRILHCYHASKTQSLYYLGAAKEPLAAAGPVVARKLHDMLVSGPAAAHAVSHTEVELRERQPPAADLVRYLAGRVRHSVLARTVHSNRRRQWFIAWRDDARQFTVNRREFLPSGFRDFRGRTGMGYADPFPFAWGGKNLLFIEEILPDERGRLVVTEIRDGREPDEPPTIILDKPYHLSYPFVFEHEGEYYLIPETRDNRTIELYRATRFPYDWELHSVRNEGLGFVDTTPFFHQGRWYFFVTTADMKKCVPMETFLFSSDRLDGAWTYHPSNPISSDVRRSRGAGRPFQWHGRWVRPVQDCSLDYGMAIRLMAIEKFTPEEYVEREIGVIDCGWHPDAVRTHTLNSSEYLETIDGSRWVK